MKFSLKDSARQREGLETNAARGKTAPYQITPSRCPLRVQGSIPLKDPKYNTLGIFEVANKQTVTKTLYLLSKSPSVHQQPSF